MANIFLLSELSVLSDPIYDGCAGFRKKGFNAFISHRATEPAEKEKL
mgnify:CR=1 FL=1